MFYARIVSSPASAILYVGLHIRDSKWDVRQKGLCDDVFVTFLRMNYASCTLSTCASHGQFGCGDGKFIGCRVLSVETCCLPVTTT